MSAPTRQKAEAALRKLCDLADIGYFDSESAATLRAFIGAVPQWRPISEAPKECGAEVLGWFPKLKLDDDGDPTDEVIGGAIAQVSREQAGGWTEPEWLSAHGSYFMDDYCFADEPTLWQPLPAPPSTAKDDTQ